MSRHRVLIVDHTAELGGAELALCRLLPALSDVADVRVLVLADGPLVDRLRSAGTPVTVVALPADLLELQRSRAGATPQQIVRNVTRALPHMVRVARAIRAGKPDLVQTTSLKADLLTLPVATMSRIPVIWHVHDRISDDYLPRLMVRLLRSAARVAPQAVVVNSLATAATLRGVRHLTVAYPGFSPDQVGPSPRSRRWPTVRTVGMLGRISPTKGQLEFVRAAAQALTRHPDLTFRIIGGALFGTTDYADAVRTEAQRLGLGEKIQFSGEVADPSAELDGLSLLVHASPVPEPFGQVIVEAMIRGVPVIATDAGGATEILRPRPDTEPLGWLVPPGDSGALAEAMVEAMSDPDEALRRAERAWESALERFPVEKTAERVAAAWSQVLAPNGAPAKTRGTPS